MSKVTRRWIELQFDAPGALRSEDIYYSASLTVKQKLDEIANYLATDESFIIYDDEDETKGLRFECSPITTDNTRVVLAPDEDIDLGWLPKLLPAKPPNLSTKTMSIANTYSCSMHDSGDVHAITIDSQVPQSVSMSNFYNGDTGTLSCEIDGVSAGSRVLSTASDVGTYTALHITDDSDPYVGQAQKAGFYKQLSAYMQATSNLAYDVAHTYQMKHSITGDTTLLTFWCDNPGTVTITNQAVNSRPASCTRYVSGVPSLATGDVITCDLDVVNAIRKHYNTPKLATLSSSQTSSTDIAPPTTPPSENSTVSYTNKGVTILTNKYSENIQITAQGFNSKGVGGTTATISTTSRVDTVSDETPRKISGSGQYPSSGYGGTFGYSTSLKTTYTEELQLLNGLYQRPTGNYSSNLPTAGPDYSSGMGTDVRYVTFQPTSLSSNYTFTITFNGTTGTWTGTNQNTTGLSVYAKVEGVTGWIDCNTAYPGVGSPSADGDPAMVTANSTYTVKKVTLGSTVRTGTLYVRIGLPSGSDKKFTGITISAVA